MDTRTPKNPAFSASSGQVTGIILAAGQSTRMGKTKQVLPYKGRTILDQVINTALASDLDHVLLILGHEAAQIRAQIQHRDRLGIVINPEYDRGQNTSVQAGIRAMAKPSTDSRLSPLPETGSPPDGAMFILGDMPRVQVSTINTMIARFKEKVPGLLIPYYDQKRGNPVIIRKDLWPDLEHLPPDSGARAIFKRHEHQILRLDVPDPGILFDVDTPQNYLTLNRLPRDD